MDLFYEMDQYDRRVEAHRKMIKEIRKYPTVFENVHESIYRSYQILAKAKELLKKGVPGDVVLELINEMDEKEEDKQDA